MESRRIDAFSDGVFAIAITLLILELRAPDLDGAASNGELWRALRGLWPSYLAFVFSFVVILIMWVNHHGLFLMARDVDGLVKFANGPLLLMVTFVSFPTAVLARHLGTPAADAAAAFYCGTFVAISVTYNLLFYAIAFRRRLVIDDVPDAALRRVKITYLLGLGVYILATALALWHAAVGLALCLALWLVWIGLSYGGSAPPDRGERKQ